MKGAIEIICENASRQGRDRSMGRTYDLSPDLTDMLSRDEGITEAFSNSTKKVKKVRNRIEASGVLAGMEIANKRDPLKKQPSERYMTATELPRQLRVSDSSCWRLGHVFGNASLAQVFAKLVEDDRIPLSDGCEGSTILRGLAQLRQLRRRAHGRALTWQDALLIDDLLEAYWSVDDDLDVVLRETLRLLTQSDSAIKDLVLAWQNIQEGVIGASAHDDCQNKEKRYRSVQ